MVQQKEFIAAFKEVFVYQARRKFGLSEDLSTVGKFVRPLLIPIYILLLYFFTQNHIRIPIVLLTFAGCTWLSMIAMDSIQMIFHRRRELAKGNNLFREVEEFKFREKLVTYAISASVVTGIFAAAMFLITFCRTGEVNVHVFIGMLSILPVLFYYLRNDCKPRFKRDL